MNEILATLLFVVFIILALVPIALSVMVEHEKYTEIQKDSENEK